MSELRKCRVCGKTTEIEHDHSTIGTLSSEAAHAYWMDRRENAPKSWK